MGLEAQLDIPTKGKGDPEDIESRLRDFEDAEDGTVYCDIEPKILENVENCENPDDPLPQRSVKLPSPIKSSMLCKQTPQINQAYCDTEECLNASWIKELSAKQHMKKGETNTVDTSIHEIHTVFRVTTLLRGSSRVASLHITV